MSDSVCRLLPLRCRGNGDSLLITIQDYYPSKPNAKFNWTGALLTPVVSVTEYHGEILRKIGEKVAMVRLCAK
jgi:hypothetical protein